MHGYLADKRSFAYQYPFFSRDFECYFLDLKGFGENVGMDYPYSLSDYLEEVKEFIYKKGLKSPNVIAHSFGARIALKGASQDEELFNKMVLTGAAGLKPRLTIKKLVKISAFKMLKPFLKRERLEKFYSSDYRALSPVMKESFKLIINERLDGELVKIKNPTLLVFGKNDKETPLYMARRLNRGIANSTLKVFDNAGHFCFIDKSAKFNMEVREFLLS